MSSHFLPILIQKVIPPPLRTHQEALDVCAADGASLPKLLTKDDFQSLKHYVNTDNLQNVWASLLKLNSTTKCTDSTCDGLVEWAGEQSNRKIEISLARIHSAKTGCIYIFQLPQTVSPSFAVQKSNFG